MWFFNFLNSSASVSKKRLKDLAIFRIENKDCLSSADYGLSYSIWGINLMLVIKDFVVSVIWRVSEWLLLNVKWVIFQLYNGEIKLYFNEMMTARQTCLAEFIYWLLKQQSMGRHVNPFGSIFLIPSQPVIALTS